MWNDASKLFKDYKLHVAHTKDVGYWAAKKYHDRDFQGSTIVRLFICGCMWVKTIQKIKDIYFWKGFKQDFSGSCFMQAIFTRYRGVIYMLQHYGLQHLTVLPSAIRGISIFFGNTLNLRQHCSRRKLRHGELSIYFTMKFLQFLGKSVKFFKKFYFYVLCTFVSELGRSFSTNSRFK